MLNDEDREAIWFVLLATLGGLIGYLSSALSEKRQVKGTVAAIKAVSSGFLGYVLVLLCREYQLSYEVTGVICSIFGWIGSDAVVPLLEKIAKRRLGIADDNLFYPKYDGEGRRATDKTEVVVFKVDAKGIIRNVTENVVALFGHNKDYFIGRDHGSIIPYEYRHAHHAAFGARAEDPEIKAVNPFGRAVHVYGMDGQRIECRVDIKEVIEPEGKMFFAYLSRRLQTPEEKFEGEQT